MTAGRLTSKSKVSVHASNGIKVQSVAADGDVAFSAGSGLLTIDGEATSLAAIQLTTDGDLTVGRIDAGQTASLSSASGQVQVAGAAKAVGVLSISATAGAISAASLASSDNISLTAGRDIGVTGDILAAGNVVATAQSISSNSIVSGIDFAATAADSNGKPMLGSSGSLQLTATGDIASGTLLSAGTTDIAAAQLEAQSLSSHGKIDINAATDVSGQLLGAGDVHIAGKTVKVGSIVSGVDFAATDAANGSVMLANTGGLTIDATGGGIVAGEVLSAGDLAATAATFAANKVTSHGNVAIDGSVDVSDQLLAGQDISLSAKDVSVGSLVSGVDFGATAKAGGNIVLQTSGAMQINASGEVTAGTLLTAGDLSARTATLTATDITSHGSIAIHGSVAVSGKLVAASDVTINGGSLSAGLLASGVDFAASEASGGNIVVASTGDMALIADGGTIDAANILAAGDLKVTAANIKAAGIDGHRNVDLAGNVDISGQLLGARDVHIRGNTVTAAAVISGVDFAASASPSGAIVLGTSGDLTINAAGGAVAAGTLLSAARLAVTSNLFTAEMATGHGDVAIAADTKVDGRIVGGGNVVVTGAGIEAGGILSGVDFAATSQSSTGDFVLGQTGDLSLTATSGSVKAGNLQSAGGLTATAAQDIAANAVAHQAMTMTAAGAITLSGQSIAGGAINLNASSTSVDTLVSGMDFAATNASPDGSVMLNRTGGMSLNASGGSITANTLLSGGDLSAKAAQDVAYQSLQSMGSASLAATSGTISVDKATHAEGDITLAAQAVDLSNNRSQVATGRTLTVSANSATLAGSTITVGGLDLNVAGAADVTNAQLNAVTNAGGTGNIAINSATLATSAATAVLAANDLALTVPSLGNSGQFAAGHDLSFSIAGDLVNTPSGLIYAGNDARILTGGNLTNDQGAILAGQNLTLAGATADQKSRSVTNISGLIQSGGDMAILTDNLTNKRVVTPAVTRGVLISSGKVSDFQLNPDVAGQPFAYLENQEQNVSQLYPGIDPPSWSDYEPKLWSGAALPDGTKYHAWTWISGLGPTEVGPILDWIKDRVPQDANGIPTLDPSNPSRYFIVDQVIKHSIADTSTTYSWDPSAHLSQSVYEDQFAAPLTPEARIHAGGNLNVDATTLDNSFSTVEAGGDAVLKGSVLDNEGVALSRTTTTTCTADGPCQAFDAAGNRNPSKDIANGTSIVSSIDGIGGAGGSIRAGGLLDASGYATVNNTAAPGSMASSATLATPAASSDPLTALNGLTAATALFSVNSALQAVSADASPGTIGSAPSIGGNGLMAKLTLVIGNGTTSLADSFRINGDAMVGAAKPQSGGVGGTIPGQAFLFETRAAFLDVGKFYGSSYFIDRIGYKPQDRILFLGDAYFQNQLVDEQMRSLAGEGLGSNAFVPGNDAVSQMKTLLDNGAAYAEAQNLAFGAALTPEQAAQLTQSMVIYQTQTIDGAQVIVPMFYMAPADKQKISVAGAMLSGNTVNMNVDSLVNSGSVAATNSLNIAAASIKADGGDFKSGGYLRLASTGALTLSTQSMTIGGQTMVNPNGGANADGNLILSAHDLVLSGVTLNAGKNASLHADTVTLDVAKVSNGGQQNATGARVTAGGNLAIVATENVTVVGSSVKAGGNLGIGADKGSVDIVTTDLAHQTGGIDNLTMSTDQKQSQLSSGGGTVITAGDGILISGSSIKAGGDVGLQAGGDINLTPAATKTTTSFADGGATASSTELGHQGSEITSGGSVTVKAGKDLNIIGSKIAADQSVSLDADGNITIAGVAGTTQADYHQKSGGHEETSHTETSTVLGSSISGTLGVGIKSGGDTTVSASKIAAGDAGNKADLTISTGGDLVIASGTDKTVVSEAGKERGFLSTKKTSHNGSDETTVGSDLDASGNVVLNAGKAAVVSGSKVTAGASLDIEGDSVAIIGAEEDHSSADSKSKSGLFAGSGDGFFSLWGKAQNDKTGTATLNVGSQLKAGDNVTLTARKTDLDIIGSSIDAGQDIALKAANDVNIMPGAESLSQSEQQKKSGFGFSFSIGDGGFSIGIGAQKSKDSTARQADTNSVSTVSAGGNLSVFAGNNVNLQGAQVSAEHDVRLHADNDVNLLAANDITNFEEMHEKTFAGVTANVSSQVGRAAQSIADSAKRLSDDGHVNAVTNTAIAGLGVYQGYKDLKSAYGNFTNGNGLSFDIGINAGVNHQQSKSSTTTSSPVVTTIRAGNSVSIVAENGSITGKGAQIAAGYDKFGLPTVSDDPLNGDIFLSAKNGDINLSAAEQTLDTSSSNSSWSVGVGVDLGCSTAANKCGANVGVNGSYGKGSSSSTGLSHVNTHVTGTGDVTIVTNDLALRGATVTGKSVVADVRNLTIESLADTADAKANQMNLSAEAGTGGINFSGTVQKASGNTLFVPEQSGIHAGTGGLDIKVAQKTSLIGGLITSQASANDNQFETGTLTVADIDTHSTWKASTFGGSIGSGGLSIAPPVKEGDDKKGQVLSAIGANIPVTITDPQHQLQDIGTLRRDTDNTNGSMPGLPDLQNILHDQYKTQADLQAAQKAMAGVVGDIAGAIYADALKRGDGAAADLWQEGGPGRALLHAIGGGILGGAAGWEGALKGSIGAATSSLLTPAIADLVNAMLKGTKYEGTEEGRNLAAVIGKSLSTVVGGVAGGGEGASYGAAQYQYNYLTHKQLDEANKERADLEEKIANCKASLGSACSAQRLTLLEDDLQDSTAQYRQLSDANNAALVQACAASFTSAACVSGRRELQNAVDEEYGLQARVLQTSAVNTPDALLLQVLDNVAAGTAPAAGIETQYKQSLSNHQTTIDGVAALALLAATGVVVGPKIYAYCAANSSACANLVTEAVDCVATIACTSTAGGVLSIGVAGKVVGELEQAAASGAVGAAKIGPWSKGASNVIEGGTFTQCGNGSCVAATGQILSDGVVTEAELVDKIGEWSNPTVLADALNELMPGSGWKGTYFADGADALKAATKGTFGAVLQAPMAPAHMVTISPSEIAGVFMVQDTGAGATYSVTSAWIELYVSAGVWRIK